MFRRLIAIGTIGALILGGYSVTRDNSITNNIPSSYHSVATLKPVGTNSKVEGEVQFVQHINQNNTEIRGHLNHLPPATGGNVQSIELRVVGDEGHPARNETIHLSEQIQVIDGHLQHKINSVTDIDGKTLFVMRTQGDREPLAKGLIMSREFFNEALPPVEHNNPIIKVGNRVVSS